MSCTPYRTLMGAFRAEHRESATVLTCNSLEGNTMSQRVGLLNSSFRKPLLYPLSYGDLCCFESVYAATVRIGTGRSYPWGRR
jgi:hypothetical protein